MLVSINQTLFIVNEKISPLRKGYLLIKDCFGYITHQAVLHNPESEVNVSHIRSGLYQVELVIGDSINVLKIFKK
jgi:hypothetical protein